MVLDLKKHLGRIEAPKGETIEVNVITVNGGKELYDLARWAKDGKRISGVFLEWHQLLELKKILCKICALKK